MDDRKFGELSAQVSAHVIEAIIAASKMAKLDFNGLMTMATGAFASFAATISRSEDNNTWQERAKDLLEQMASTGSNMIDTMPVEEINVKETEH